MKGSNYARDKHPVGRRESKISNASSTVSSNESKLLILVTSADTSPYVIPQRRIRLSMEAGRDELGRGTWN